MVNHPSDKSSKASQCVHLAFAADEGYAMPLAVSLYSTLCHLKAPASVIVHLLDGGLTENTHRRLHGIAVTAGAAIVWHDTTSLLPPYMKGVRHISPATYLRLLLPELLPVDVDRVTYLDSDLLVCGDVSELANVDLNGHTIGAVRDFAVASISHPYSGVKNWQDLGYEADQPCFNGGVLVMDLKQWRKRRLTERVSDYIKTHGAQLNNCDQDALNAVLANDWEELSLEWNVQYALYYVEALGTGEFYAALKSDRKRLHGAGKIFHFTGTPKPWDHWCGHPASAKWVKDLTQSRWFSPLRRWQWSLRYHSRRAYYMTNVYLGRAHLRERSD